MNVFCFKSEVKPFDCWRSAMRRIYRSMTGVINIVFTAAMLGLAAAFFESAKPLEKSLILLGCIWFPLIQPTIIYLQQRKSIRSMPKDMELSFSDSGMQVHLAEKEESIPWNKMHRISIEPGMVILFTDERHGYILTNRNMGQEREAFLSFLKQHN